MVVRIRFARHGTRNNPIFHIVAINQRQARDAKPIEKLGIYDPKSGPTQPKRIEWSVDRIRYWLGVGAQPSKSVVRLLDMVLFEFTQPNLVWADIVSSFCRRTSFLRMQSTNVTRIRPHLGQYLLQKPILPLYEVIP